MVTKKYKTLKSISTILNLNNIIKTSLFFCFVQIKHLNHNELFVLKQVTSQFGLNIFVCKNNFLTLKSYLPMLSKYLWSNLNHGNLIILYSNNYSVLINKFFATDLALRKIQMCPLIFYFFNRFLLPRDFFEIYKSSKRNVFYNLIYILQYHSYDIFNKLILVNKVLLYSLNSKQV